MTTTAEPTTAELGRSRTRKEDARLITGRTRWTDNIALPGLLHLSVVRSPVAHARITGIDTEEARQLPGVLGVFTARDLGAEEIALPCAWTIVPDQKAPQRPPLAVDTVHFAGEGVAIVLARDAATARDASELVVVDYDDLPPVLDMEAAVAEGATLLHPDLGTNASAHYVFDSAESGTGDDADRLIAAAETDPDSIVVRRRYRQQRLIPAFMEPRSVVVDPTGEQYVIWSSTQVPHFVKVFMSLLTGIPEHKLRVIAPDVGGGFGGKLQVTPEEVLCTLAARKLGRPVKWTETRSESLLSAHHGRDQIQDITLAAKRDGTVTALKVELLADMGAYLALVGVGGPDPRRVPLQLDLQVPGLPLRVHERVHLEDANRRLPGCRAARGDLRDRADDGRARRRAGPRPDGRAAAELDQARGVPFHHRRGAALRLREL